MKKFRNALILVLCALLLVGGSVAATLAFLTAEDEVVNTFTVGDVAITLDEAPVDAEGQATDGTRVKENDYHLIPNKSYDKDPTVHVGDESEDCWVFVKLVNEIKDIVATETIEEQMTANGWSIIDADANIWAHEDKASAGDDIVVFEEFTVIGAGLTNTELADYDGKTIKVTAYAIQAEGFNDAETAWAQAGAEADANIQ